jgi:hypothetical protein
LGSSQIGLPKAGTNCPCAAMLLIKALQDSLLTRSGVRR